MRVNRKRAMNRAIVKSAAEKSYAAESVIKGELQVEMPTWTKKVMEPFPDLYTE